MLNGQTRGQTGHKKSPGNGAVVGQAVAAITVTATHIGFSHRHFRRIARLMLLWLDSVISVVVVVAYLGTFSASTITLIAGTASPYAQDAALILLSLMVMVILGATVSGKLVALRSTAVLF